MLWGEGGGGEEDWSGGRVFERIVRKVRECRYVLLRGSLSLLTSFPRDGRNWKMVVEGKEGEKEKRGGFSGDKVADEGRLDQSVWVGVVETRAHEGRKWTCKRGFFFRKFPLSRRESLHQAPRNLQDTLVSGTVEILSLILSSLLYCSSDSCSITR